MEAYLANNMLFRDINLQSEHKFDCEAKKSLNCEISRNNFLFYRAETSFYTTCLCCPKL